MVTMAIRMTRLQVYPVPPRSPPRPGSSCSLLMSRAIKKCAFVFVRSLNELELLTRCHRSEGLRPRVTGYGLWAMGNGFQGRGRSDFVSLSSHLELGDKTNLFSLFITLCRYRFRFRMRSSDGHLRLIPDPRTQPQTFRKTSKIFTVIPQCTVVLDWRNL